MAATKYPICDRIELSRRHGAQMPFAPPEGLHRGEVPPDWVMDSATSMIMSPEVFERLTAERRAYQAEVKAGVISSTRESIKGNKAEERARRSGLAELIAEIAAVDLENTAEIIRLGHRLVSAGAAIAQVRTELHGQVTNLSELEAR